MRSGGVEERNLFRRYKHGFQIFEQCGQHDMIRRGAGNIVKNNANLIVRAEQFRKRRRSDRLF